MARIPYPERAEIAPKLADYLGKLAPLNLNRMFGHGDAVGLAYARLGVAIINRGQLHERLRELAILRVGHLAGSSYELHQHLSFARLVGLSEAKIEAVAAGPSSAVFDDLERAVLAYVDDVYARPRASEAVFDEAAQRLSKGQLLELTILVGYYMATARILETFEIELEPGEGLGAFLGAER